MKIPWQTIMQPTIEEILRTASVPGIVIALAQEDGSVEHLVSWGPMDKQVHCVPIPSFPSPRSPSWRPRWLSCAWQRLGR